MKSSLAVLFLCLISTSLYADIYKCNHNGRIEFSDLRCGDRAELVRLNFYRPSAAAVQYQQQQIESLNDGFRADEMSKLSELNKTLEQKLADLVSERDDTLQQLKQKTYLREDGVLVSREHGVFQQINMEIQKYQQKIQQAQSELVQNRSKLTQLQQQSAAE